MGANGLDIDDGAPMSFRDQVGLWLEIWTAVAPELRDQARAKADPGTDPWGYLVALDEFVEARGLTRPSAVGVEEGRTGKVGEGPCDGLAIPDVVGQEPELAAVPRTVSRGQLGDLAGHHTLEPRRCHVDAVGGRSA